MATIFFPSTMNFYTRKSLVLQCPFSVVKLKNYTFQYFPGIGLNMEGGVSSQCLMSYVMIEFDLSTFKSKLSENWRSFLLNDLRNVYEF